MKKLNFFRTISLLSLLIVALFSASCFADTTSINDYDDLKLYSELNFIPYAEDSIRLLSEGQYEIPTNASQMNLYANSENLAIGINGTTSLSIGGDAKSISDTLLITYAVTLDEYGSLTIYGNNTSKHTVITALFEQNGGIFNVHGNKGNGAAYTYAFDSTLFVLADGIVNATGGTNDFAIGLHTKDFEQKGGEVTSSGGYQGDGIYCTGSYVLAGGTIDTVGGSYFGAYGIYANGFIVYDGTLLTLGGQGAKSHGLRVSGQLVQVDGSIIAKGSNDGGSEGLWIVSQLIQMGGTIEAVGGNTNDVCGVIVDQDLLLLKGSMKLTGGSTDLAYGMCVGKKAYINGEIIFTSEGTAPGLYVGNTDSTNNTIFAADPILNVDQSIFYKESAITFRENAVISVEVDALQKDKVLIVVSNKGIAVEEGSKVKVSAFKNFESLEKGDTVEITLFWFRNVSLGRADIFEIVNPEPENYDVRLELSENGTDLMLVVEKL